MSLVELPPELDKVVSEIARRTGKTKQQVIIDILTGKDEVDIDKIKSLAESLAQLPVPNTTALGGNLNLAQMLKEMTMTMLYLKMMESLGGGSRIDIDKIIALKMLNQPDITQLILPILLQGKNNNDDSRREIMEMIKMMQEQNQKFNEMLMNILVGNRMQELEKKVNEELPQYVDTLVSKTIEQLMEQVRNEIQMHIDQIAGRLNTMPQPERENEIDRMAREIAKTIVKESIERVKKDIERRFKAEDTPEALKRLDYDKLFEKTFDLAKDVLKSILSRPPQPQTPPPLREVRQIQLPSQAGAPQPPAQQEPEAEYAEEPQQEEGQDNNPWLEVHEK